MFCLCDVTVFLEPLEARTTPSEVQEKAGGFPHLELGGSMAVLGSVLLLQLLGCLRTHFDPNTLSISHKWIVVLKLLLSGDFAPVDK